MTTLTMPAPILHRADRFGQMWHGKSVTVVGLGKSGLAAATWLARLGCRVRVTESRETDSLREARASLLALGVEEIELGGHSRRFIDHAELVVVSPGVAESTGPVQWATTLERPMLSEIELAFHFCPCPIIAVTGTNGKSTAVTLLAAVLQASRRDAIACGNLGTPFSSVLDQLTPESLAVVEVSSFQLLGCEQFHPMIGVLLNLGTNHLDRHQDTSAYVAAKARLFQCQTSHDWAVLNGRDTAVVALSESLRARKAWFGENRSNPTLLRLDTATQRALTESAQAVLQVARLMEIPDPLTWQVMRSFRGLEHRLEGVATIRGVHFINDSKSTTPDSLVFALGRISGDVVVILGGRDKGLDFVTLIEHLHHARIKGVVLIGESRARLRPMLNGSSIVRESPTLESAVQMAAELAPPGATVLFSPACASFDMFRDFEDRGRAFKAIVHRLDEHAKE